MDVTLGAKQNRILEQYMKDKGLTPVQALEAITDHLLKLGVKPFQKGRVVQIRARKVAELPGDGLAETPKDTDRTE